MWCHEAILPWHLVLVSKCQCSDVPVMLLNIAVQDSLLLHFFLLTDLPF